MANGNGKTIKAWQVTLFISMLGVMGLGWRLTAQTADTAVKTHDTCETSHPGIRKAIDDNKDIGRILSIRVDSLISQGRTQYIKDSIIREQQYRDLLRAIKESGGG